MANASVATSRHAERVPPQPGRHPLRMMPGRYKVSTLCFACSSSQEAASSIGRATAS